MAQNLYLAPFDGGELIPIAGLQPYLIREAEALRVLDKSPADATIIVRADASTPSGVVQELIQACQRASFDKFALRVKEEVTY